MSCRLLFVIHSIRSTCTCMLISKLNFPCEVYYSNSNYEISNNSDAKCSYKLEIQ